MLYRRGPLGGIDIALPGSDRPATVQECGCLAKMAYTQDKRIIAIDTPLGKDVLLLHGFAAQEGISRLFRISAESLSENATIVSTKTIAKQVSISLTLATASKRYFNSHVHP